MNKIHAAYQKLGLHPGDDFDLTKRRYKMLVLVWHPDRMTTDEGRKLAEEELKNINNAFDCLKKHFESAHLQGPACECQPAQKSNQQAEARDNQKQGAHGNGQTGNSHANSNPGGYQREQTAYEKWAEQEARAKEAERRRAEETAAALKEALEKARQAAEAQAAAAAAAKAKAQTAVMPMTEEQLRWRISIVLGIIFLFLLMGGFNKRYEPSARLSTEFPMAEHLRQSPFLN